MSISSRKTLIGFAVAFGCCTDAAAPAAADPGLAGEPDPFGTLSCSCRETAPPGNVDPREEIARGIRKGHSAWVPGFPAPSPPTQPPP